MTQWALPIGNYGTTTLVEVNGDGDGDWFDEFDEGHGAGRGSGSGPDDNTTAWGKGNPADGDLIQTDLATVTDPVSSSGHIVRSRSFKSASGGVQIDVAVRLLQGGSEVAVTTAVDLAAGWQTVTLTLSGAEADSISDYSDLQIESDPVIVGGGDARGYRESAHEFECPDVSARRIFVVS